MIRFWPAVGHGVYALQKLKTCQKLKILAHHIEPHRNCTSQQRENGQQWQASETKSASDNINALYRQTDVTVVLRCT
jgi:hypothetical protein